MSISNGRPLNLSSLGEEPGGVEFQHKTGPEPADKGERSSKSFEDDASEVGQKVGEGSSSRDPGDPGTARSEEELKKTG